MSKRRFVFPGVADDPIEVEPGMYTAEEMQFEKYRRINAVSNSSMSAAICNVAPLLISMASYLKQQPLKETPWLRFGTLCHEAKFEFRKALDSYDVIPDLINFDIDESGTLIPSKCKTKTGKETDSKNSDEYQARLLKYKSHPSKIGKSFVEQDAIEDLGGILNALDQDQVTRELYRNNGPLKTQYELTIVWIDPETGLKCKGRVDCAQHETRRLPDLKTSKDAAGHFDKAVGNLGYHRQGAFYSDGMRVVTGAEYEPWCVAAKPDGPVFGVRAKAIGYQTLLAGRHQYRQVLDRIGRGIAYGNWPMFEELNHQDKWEIPQYMMPFV